MERGNLAAMNKTEMNGGVQKKALLTGSLAHFIQDGFSDMLYIFFPLWQAQFALSFVEIGFLKTLFSGTMAGFQVPATSLAQRVGERRLLVAGIALTGAAVWGIGYAATPLLLGCLLVLGGFGASVQHPISSSLISNAYTGIQERRAALSTFNVAGDIGKLALPGATAYLLLTLHWTTVSQLLGLFGIAIAVGLYWLQRTTAGSGAAAPTVAPRPATGRLGWRGQEAFWSLSAIGVLDSATRMGFLTFLPFLLQGKGAGIATIGLVFSLIFAGGAAGKLVCGMLATRVGVLRSVIVTETLTTVCILAMIFCPLQSAIGLAPLIGVVLNGTSSVLYGSVPELVREERRQQAFAIFYTMTIGSGALSPSLYGALSDGIGVESAVLVVAAATLLTLPLTLPLRGKLAAKR